MQVAILVDSNGFAVAGADDSFGFVGQVDADAAMLALHIDECDVVLGGHRVGNAAYLNLD